MKSSCRRGIAALLPILALTPLAAGAQFGNFEDLGLANKTELSVVVTEGNSNTETFGFKHALTRTWTRSRYRLRLEGVRADTGDDRFALVDASAPDGFVVVEPEPEVDVEKYLVENRYDRRIGSGRAFWNVGLTWDRNRDAGILNRYVAFAGAGHLWFRDEGRGEFYTTYGLSYTDREEETPDPTKDERFLGARLGWFYERKLGSVTTYTNEWRFNSNLSRFSDFASDMTNAVAVSMNERLALKVSLQWLYNHEPALETIDLVEIIDGTTTKVGSVQVHKKPSDLVFNTALVLSF